MLTADCSYNATAPYTTLHISINFTGEYSVHMASLCTVQADYAHRVSITVYTNAVLCIRVENPNTQGLAAGSDGKWLQDSHAWTAALHM